MEPTPYLFHTHNITIMTGRVHSTSFDQLNKYIYNKNSL